MSNYVTLSMSTEEYREIIDALMSYVTGLDNYYSIEDIIHLIDALEGEYEYDMAKQNMEYKKFNEYEELFNERFNDENFKDKDGHINEKGMKEYKNFYEINQVLEDYKEGGVLDILDTKQQFCLIFDLINAMDVEIFYGD